MIEDGVSDDQVKESLKAKKDLLEQLGTNLHHDAITGTAKQYVTEMLPSDWSRTVVNKWITFMWGVSTRVNFMWGVA